MHAFSPSGRQKIAEHTQKIEPSPERAKGYQFYHLERNGKRIAETIERNHGSYGDMLRSLRILVEASVVTEHITKKGMFGQFQFEDGSTIN